MLRIDVLTIFPELFAPFRRVGVLGAALEKGLLALEVHDLRRFAHDRRRTVDDAPYGGGPGMVMKPEPLVEAIEALGGGRGGDAHVVLLTPQGRRFTQPLAQQFARSGHLLLVCGRYEGIDQRVIELAVDEEISIGDYVLSGGEAPALVVIEALSRFVPGVLGNPASAPGDSFQHGLLEGPQYTRPEAFRGRRVPEVLRSGDHRRIQSWREAAALEQTRTKRPDLLGERGDK